jgi:hypothetical protein
MESSSVLCSNRAAILVVLCAWLCHAQMTHQDACEAVFAKCQALLGAFGAKKAEGVVPLAAVIGETGSPSPVSKGALIEL